MIDVSNLNINETITVGGIDIMLLMIAIVFGHKDLVEAMLTNGADLVKVSFSGASVYELLCEEMKHPNSDKHF